MKLDIFPHIFPTAFYEKMMKLSERAGYMQKRVREIPVLADLELRFRMMDPVRRLPAGPHVGFAAAGGFWRPPVFPRAGAHCQ